MSLEMWIAFVVAAMIVLVIPGPTILLVISQSISHGRRAVVPLVTGVTLGDFTAMTLSLLGLGAILAASATLYAVFAGHLRDTMKSSKVRRWFNKKHLPLCTQCLVEQR